MFTRFTHPNRTEPHVAPRRTTDRAVSPVIGGILMFGLVMAMVMLIQVTGVPVWNAQEEFQHSQRVQEDFQELDSAVASVAADGGARDVVVESGMEYPTRPLLFNPPAVSGSFRTTDAANIELVNIDASGVDNYWTGTKTYPTRAIEYQPQYRVGDRREMVVYENSVAYRRYVSTDGGPDVVVPLDDQSLINGKRLTLVALDGTVSETGAATTSLTLVPISAPSAPVSVTNTAGDSITVRVPTQLTTEDWNDLLEGELESQGGYVVDSSVSVVDGVLSFQLTADEEYSLRMAKVGVKESYDSAEPAWYISTVNDEVVPMYSGESQVLTAQVRDLYNNPVSNVEVTFDAGSEGQFIRADGSHARTYTVRTETDGYAHARYTNIVPNTASAVTVGGDLNSDGTTQPWESVTYTVSATKAWDSINDINPPLGAGQVTLTDVVKTQGASNSVTLEFTNDATVELTITKMRVAFYAADQQDKATQLTYGSDTLTIGGDFQSVSGPELSATGDAAGDDVKELELIVDTSPVTGDMFVLSVEYTEPNGVTRQLTYFIDVP